MKKIRSSDQGSIFDLIGGKFFDDLNQKDRSISTFPNSYIQKNPVQMYFWLIFIFQMIKITEFYVLIQCINCNPLIQVVKIRKLLVKIDRRS